MSKKDRSWERGENPDPATELMVQKYYTLLTVRRSVSGEMATCGEKNKKENSEHRQNLPLILNQRKILHISVSRYGVGSLSLKCCMTD